MIKKHILFTGLSLLASANLALQTVSNLHPPSLSHDPQIFISSTSPHPTTQVNNHRAQSISPPQVSAINISNSSTEIASNTTEYIPSIPALTRPIRANSPDYPYSALPFSTGTVSSSGSTEPWWLSKIHAPLTTTKSPGALIAVIDTGFALAHNGFADRWWKNTAEIGPTISEGPVPNCTSRGLLLDKSCNNIDNDGDGYPSDWRGWDFTSDDNSAQAGSTNPSGSAVGHGTFVAGLIASSLTSTSGGADTNARIMTLQALTDEGNGSTTTVADAILYAADHGAQIISLSLGTSSDDPYLHQAITYAIEKGSIIVAAAGNNGCDCMLFPANYPEVIAVGASTQSDILATFSSYGANLDLVAPGQDLCSTTWTSSNTTSAYACGGAGTSFSTPIIAGALARLLEAGVQPQLADQYLDITADKVSSMGAAWRTLQYGTGRVNIQASITALSGPHYSGASGGIFRTPCTGTAACSVELTNTAGTVIISTSKSPIGTASSNYTATPSTATYGTVWLVNDVNSSTISYYSFTN